MELDVKLFPIANLTPFGTESRKSFVSNYEAELVYEAFLSCIIDIYNSSCYSTLHSYVNEE